MVSARTIRLSIFCLSSFCGLAAAHAEQDPEDVAALLPAAHTDVEIGLGLMTSGLGVMVGHRFANGVRLEGAVGTLLLVNGATVAGGGSLRVIDSTEDALEIPLLVSATAYFSPGSLPEACDDDGGESDCSDGGGGSGVVGAVLTGLDWVHGDPRKEGSNFILSLRVGPGWDGSEVGVVPQLAAGWSF